MSGPATCCTCPGWDPRTRPAAPPPSGKVGSDLTAEEGYEAARLTGINIIARMKGELGNLDRVNRVVKLLGMVNSDPSFNQQPAVVNGCSDLLVEVFGDKGRTPGQP